MKKGDLLPPAAKSGQRAEGWKHRGRGDENDALVREEEEGVR